MFIQTEATPNPQSLKFIPGRLLRSVENGTEGRRADFPDRKAAESDSPLAAALFAADEGVERVHFGEDWLSVTLQPGGEWALAKAAILAALMEHFVAGRPVYREDGGAGDAAENSEAAAGEGDSGGEIGAKVRELLDTYVRPAVAQDGGDIVFRGFEEGVVFLHLQGACAGCPSSTATLKMGIERLLRHHLPDVTEVRAVA